VAKQAPSAGHVARRRPHWTLWLLLAVLLGAGIGAGASLVVHSSSGSTNANAVLSARGGPAATWAPGAKPAPAFRLSDANGAPVSLAQYRGRNVVVTFVDPLCTTFCPLEAAVINEALAQLPGPRRPEVIAVSVNPPVRSGATLRKESRRFRWLPQWRWATGTKTQLAPVWTSYEIQVLPTKGDITHTEAAYLIDKSGHQRALFLWPFSAADILRTYRALN
jgi:protein SCO1/2